MTYRFCIVDDTNFMRKMAADILRNNGHEVVGEAANGKDAISQYEQLRPDIVIMDLQMPEMNGTEAIREILRIDPEAVILVCTASNQQDLVDGAMEAGAKGYLMKPFNPERLHKVIEKYAVPFLRPKMTIEEDTAALTEQPAPPAPVVTITRQGGDKMKSFVSSMMCSWEEEQNGESARFQVVCTERENRILVELTGPGDRKQTIPFSIEGFRQLSGWLEQSLGVAR
ncbi:MAG: response regulator [Cohnella sp.]|nr:response regulator [Cohnella sp.]